MYVHASPFMSTSSPGSLEGKYEVIAKIREGGMGAIYKVRHRLLNELRVIKVMRPEVAQSADQRKRFLREAQTATRLRHPNIVAFYDFFVDEEDTAYMVMEYIEGVNLRDVVRSLGAFPIPLAIDLSRQCLSAFDYLHRKGIVHRDVSPDNIMMTREEDGSLRAKLIDLGIAKIAQAKEELTAADEFIGKLRYSSPEQLTKSASSPQIDGRSDLFSFGIVLYEILTGVCPYGGESLHEIIANRLELPPLSFDISDPSGRLPPVLKQAIGKALERSPADRYQTAGEFSDAIEPFAETGGEEHRRELEKFVDGAMGLAAKASIGQERGASDLGPTVRANLDANEPAGLESSRDLKFRDTIARWSPTPPSAAAAAGEPRPMVRGKPARAELTGITFPPRGDVTSREERRRRSPVVTYGAVAVAAALLVGFGVWISRPRERTRFDRPETTVSPAPVARASPGLPREIENVGPSRERAPELQPTAGVPAEPTGVPTPRDVRASGPAVSTPRQRPRPTAPPRVAELLPTKPAVRGSEAGGSVSPRGEAAVSGAPAAPATGAPRMHYCSEIEETVYRQGVTKDVPSGFEGMAAKAPRPDSGLMRINISLSKNRPADDEPFFVAVRFENGGDARVDVQRLEESSSRGGLRPIAGAAVPVTVSPGGIKELFRYPLTLSGGEPYSKVFVVSDAKGDSWRAGIRLVPCAD